VKGRMRFLVTIILSSLFVFPVFAQTQTTEKNTEQKKSIQPTEKDLNEILEGFRDSDKILKQNAARREVVEVEGAEYPGLEMNIVPIGQQVIQPRMENVLKLQAQDEYMLYRSYDYTRSLTGRPQKPARLFEIPITPGSSSDKESEEEEEQEPEE